ncbi:adenosylmethionine--8-amino-7-oxononanoate aminotransferase BioA [Platysternon megacephalum]|uniref:Adenosylmethionine--8-amino-7-oxononanoate aminotransferase BioA n=1 Tax=Platysternon megacephalum TaxID=55544 RepID=A0A4D9DHU5_9SAUR|nr:adenosylmethionine--8-amino-7-oxononanoate aminotransferase BioA [Platysternon megacephalum]
MINTCLQDLEQPAYGGKNGRPPFPTESKPGTETQRTGYRWHPPLTSDATAGKQQVSPHPGPFYGDWSSLGHQYPHGNRNNSRLGAKRLSLSMESKSSWGLEAAKKSIAGMDIWAWGKY